MTIRDCVLHRRKTTVCVHFRAPGQRGLAEESASRPSWEIEARQRSRPPIRPRGARPSSRDPRPPTPVPCSRFFDAQSELVLRAHFLVRIAVNQMYNSAAQIRFLFVAPRAGLLSPHPTPPGKALRARPTTKVMGECALAYQQFSSRRPCSRRFVAFFTSPPDRPAPAVGAIGRWHDSKSSHRRQAKLEPCQSKRPARVDRPNLKHLRSSRSPRPR